MSDGAIKPAAIKPAAIKPGAPNRLALRLTLSAGVHSVPLSRIHHLCAFASLNGTADVYFLGWLTFHGRQVPVFDLNRIVCDQPTPERFGSRILLIETASGPTPLLGLLAGGMTDTVLTAPDPNEPSPATPLDLDAYLPMLYTMVPTLDSAGPSA